MIVALLMATLSVLGAVFYARFLFALCKECRHQRSCYLVCLRNHSSEHTITDDRALEESMPRAA